MSEPKNDAMPNGVRENDEASMWWRYDGSCSLVMTHAETVRCTLEKQTLKVSRDKLMADPVSDASCPSI